MWTERPGITAVWISEHTGITTLTWLLSDSIRYFDLWPCLRMAENTRCVFSNPWFFKDRQPPFCFSGTHIFCSVFPNLDFLQKPIKLYSLQIPKMLDHWEHEKAKPVFDSRLFSAEVFVSPRESHQWLWSWPWRPHQRSLRLAMAMP